MLQQIKQRLLAAGFNAEDEERIKSVPLKLNSAGFDPWGVDPDTIRLVVSAVKWLYTDYFRVETHNIDRVPSGKVILAANHGGQIPIDGLIIALSMFLEHHPPRVVRGMTERWVPGLPFVSTLFTRVGEVIGDPKICRDLLNRDEAVLVFPEGVRGSGKNFMKRYQLQRFGTGFVRLALETGAPIVPVAAIGTEEVYPGIANFKPLARLLRAPYFPVTPFFPLLGPLGALPLPCKITLRYGDPIYFDADPDVSDEEAERMVQQVKTAMQTEIQLGLRKRKERIFTGAGK